jgi:Acetyltransferase (GNAT) domain
MIRAENGRLTIRIARSVSEVEEIRETWTKWQSNPTSDIDNFLSMVHYRPEIQRPHVMLVCRDGRADSLLVGRLEHTKISFTLGYHKLFQPNVRVLCFTHGAFLGNQSVENSQFVTRELANCLSRGEADVARLEYVEKDSTLFESVKSTPAFLCRDHFTPTQPHGCLRLPNTFKEFMGTLSRKERHNLRRYAGRVESDFPQKIRIQCFRGEGQLDDLMRDTEQIAKKTYQRALGVGFRDNFETRKLLKTAAQKGTLLACVLYLENYPAAFMIGVQYRQALHGTAMGYDPRFTEYSPGSLLLIHWIEDAFAPAASQRVAEIDLGPGEARFKRSLHNHVRNESVVYICAPTAKGIVFNFQRTLSYLVDQSARKLFPSSVVLEKVKKIWRSRARSTSHGSDPQPMRDVRYSNSAESPN